MEELNEVSGARCCMPTIHTMPRPEAIGELLGALLGLQVTVDRAPRMDLRAPAVAVVGQLVREADGALGAACVANLELAAVLGAALTTMPPVVVERSVQQGGFDVSTLIGNFEDVLNVATQLFNCADTPRLTLGAVIVLPDELPPDTARLLAGGSARRDLEVTVEGYGTGQLSVVVD
jgi:hypothetical protein